MNYPDIVTDPLSETRSEEHTNSAGLDVWSIHKFARWWLPLLLFTLGCIVLVAVHKQADVHRFLPQDTSYLDLAVAENLDGGIGYTASYPEKMPYTDSLLWQGVLRGMGVFVKDLTVAAYLINFACCIGVLLVCLSIARRMLGFQPYLFGVLCALAVSPALLSAATSGGPLALAMLLILLSVRGHLRGLDGAGPVLPASAAIYLGLAMLIRVEFGLLWLVFCLHALCAASFKWSSDLKVGFTALQAFAGLLFCAVAFWPAVHFNLQVVRVPWPAVVGSGLVLSDDGGASAQLSGTLSSRIFSSYQWLLDGSAVFGLVELLLLLLGVAVVLYVSLQEKGARAMLLPVFLLLFLPLFLGAISLVTGSEARAIVFESLVPLWMLFGVYGLFKLPFLLKANAQPGIAVAVLLCLGMGGRSAAFVQQDVRERSDERVWQETYETFLTGSERATCVTDRAGYASFRGEQRVIDLQGRASVAVLQCIDASGRLDREKTLNMLRDRKPTWFFLWQEENLEILGWLETELGAKRVVSMSSSTDGPAVFRIDWP